jgi:hypothetical protein
MLEFMAMAQFNPVTLKERDLETERSRSSIASEAVNLHSLAS